jgi:acetyl-CoA decarbonylase/synthase complex subunit beta
MKLSAPAVVPASFPFPYGNRVVADDIEDMIARGCRFGNLRRRYFRDEVIGLPDYCNPAYVNEDFKAVKVLGGRPNAFFCLRRSVAPGKKLQIAGKPARNIGVLIEIPDDQLTDDIALTVERAALKALNTMKGVRAVQTEESFFLELAEDRPPAEKEINEVLYKGVRLKYPRLKNISVSIYYDEAELAARAPEIEEYRKQRRDRIRHMTETNTDAFCVCTECRPFSLVHTCILTPDRLPMCAARTYFTAKAAALFGSDDLPYQRTREKDLPLRKVFDKGRCLDPLRGEYEGCNAAYAETTQGQLTRVFLHSIREFPITSCGCFQTLAFWIPEVRGIGIMSRGASARTPDGRTWEMLANAAGGKQTPGIAGLSLSYIRSANFLKGDGGIKNVVWVNSELREKLSDAFGPGCRVATEKDVQTMDQLRSFLGR